MMVLKVAASGGRRNLAAVDKRASEEHKNYALNQAADKIDARVSSMILMTARTQLGRNLPGTSVHVQH